MIVKFTKKPGSSFKGVTLYLTHDAEHAATSERVAWTHTLNLAHDHLPSAVDEMVWTHRNAELLKKEAGVRAGGTKVEKPVKHLSLSWHPSETPDREEMIRAAQSFLKHMGWAEHQAILIAHNDKEYRHVHLVVNAIHPVTGLKLDDGFEKRRTAAWALGYEQQRGKVFCEQRLLPIAEREASAPRPAWERLRQLQPSATERLLEAEAAHHGEDDEPRPAGWQAREWQHLKARQKEQRLAFFAQGKGAYRDLRNQLYQQVRTTYRREWAEYYAIRRAGAAPEVVAALRANLIARQTATLDQHRDVAARTLREQRDVFYRTVLDRQKADRATLIDRQERGVTSSQLWQAQQAAAMRAETAPAAPPPQTHPSPRPDHADRYGGLAWTNRAGMVAQQRSATRWLAKASARIASTPPQQQEPAPRSQLAAAEARQKQPDKRARETGKSVSAEPDP